MEIVNVFACEECGFDNATLDNAALVDAIGSFTRRYRMPLTRGLRDEDLGAVLRARPAPEVWSALEYAVHYRDALDWYGERIETVLREDRPHLEGRDFTVDPDTAGLDAPAVADQIGAAADRVATRLRALTPEEWTRVGIGSSDGGERDIRNLASRAAHEGHHHLLDIGRSLRAARS